MSIGKYNTKKNDICLEDLFSKYHGYDMKWNNYVFDTYYTMSDNYQKNCPIWKGNEDLLDTWNGVTDAFDLRDYGYYINSENDLDNVIKILKPGTKPQFNMIEISGHSFWHCTAKGSHCDVLGSTSEGHTDLAIRIVNNKLELTLFKKTSSSWEKSTSYPKFSDQCSFPKALIILLQGGGGGGGASHGTWTGDGASSGAIWAGIISTSWLTSSDRAIFIRTGDGGLGAPGQANAVGASGTATICAMVEGINFSKSAAALRDDLYTKLTDIVYRESLSPLCILADGGGGTSSNGRKDPGYVSVKYDREVLYQMLAKGGLWGGVAGQNASGAKADTAAEIQISCSKIDYHYKSDNFDYYTFVSHSGGHAGDVPKCTGAVGAPSYMGSAAQGGNPNGDAAGRRGKDNDDLGGGGGGGAYKFGTWNGGGNGAPGCVALFY